MQMGRAYEGLYSAKRRGEKTGAEAASRARKAAGRKRGGGMSAEACQRQAERMKAYWAGKRAENSTAAAPATKASARKGAKTGRRNATDQLHAISRPGRVAPRS